MARDYRCQVREKGTHYDCFVSPSKEKLYSDRTPFIDFQISQCHVTSQVTVVVVT